MFVVQDHQLAAMAQADMARFEADLVRHLLTAWPRECRQAGGRPGVERAAKRIIEVAQANGYESEREISLYASLVFILGIGFDTDPQLRWAGSGLRAASIPDTTERIERLYDDTVAYLGEVGGEDAGRVVRALVRVQRYDLAQAPGGDSETQGEALCDVMRGFWPEKVAYQGDRATITVIRKGFETAVGYGITGPAGRCVFATLQFMLGQDFHVDPVHPWAHAALTDPEVGDENAKVARLYTAALDHIAVSLTRA